MKNLIAQLFSKLFDKEEKKNLALDFSALFAYRLIIELSSKITPEKSEQFKQLLADHKTKEALDLLAAEKIDIKTTTQEFREKFIKEMQPVFKNKLEKN